MASLLRRMSSRKEKISEPEAPPTPAADEDDGRVNVRAYNKKRSASISSVDIRGPTPGEGAAPKTRRRKSFTFDKAGNPVAGGGAPGPADEETKEDTFPAKPPEKKQDATCIASAGSDYMELTIEGLDDDEWI
ncbi:hypothetical protein JL720_15984 [Aureococcus anophagefferens]|nr:hypothetical protein JL720_15984 [Aureococcus anophagefferens]